MKIAYVANIRLPTEKAHGVQIMKMCEAFADLGADVELVVPTRKTNVPDDPFTYYGVRENFMVCRLYAPDTAARGKLGFLLQSAWFALASRMYVSRRNPDIVYSRDTFVVAFGTARQIVWEMHTASWSWVARRAARRVKRIIAISGGIKKFYEDRGVPTEIISVAPDGVDLSDYEQAFALGKDGSRAMLGLPKEKKIVAYVGKMQTMGQSKGVEDIIRAVGELAAHRSDVVLLIVGLNNTEFDLARSVAASAKLPERQVILVGHVQRAQVPYYLAASDVLVMNYPNTEHYAHMMSPLKVFEYMASGTPIVSTDLPTLREVLPEDAAFYVLPDDLESLRAGIQIVLDDAAVVERGARAKKAVESYTWKHRAQGILSLLS